MAPVCQPPHSTRSAETVPAACRRRILAPDCMAGGRRDLDGQETCWLGVPAVRVPPGTGGGAARRGVPAAGGGGALELVLPPRPPPAPPPPAAPAPPRP